MGEFFYVNIVFFDDSKKLMNSSHRGHKNMKMHILSEYGNLIISNRDTEVPVIRGTTCETRSREDSDPDSFILSGPTVLTESREDSDPDEFFCDITTQNIIDYDEILLI